MGQQLINPEAGTILWTIVTFVILAFLLAWVIIRGAMKKLGAKGMAM